MPIGRGDGKRDVAPSSTALDEGALARHSSFHRGWGECPHEPSLPLRTRTRTQPAGRYSYSIRSLLPITSQAPIASSRSTSTSTLVDGPGRRSPYSPPPPPLQTSNLKLQTPPALVPRTPALSYRDRGRADSGRGVRLSANAVDRGPPRGRWFGRSPRKPLQGLPRSAGFLRLSQLERSSGCRGPHPRVHR